MKKAYLERVLHHNGTILYIKLPEKYFLPLKDKNVIFLNDGVYLKKVVNKVYLGNIELTSYNFLIKNAEICVEWWKMDEEVTKLIIDLINKLNDKIEERFSKIEGEIEEIKKEVKSGIDSDYILSLKKKLENLNETLEIIKKNITSLDTKKLEKIDHLIENFQSLEEKIINIVEKLEKLEDELPVMFYHLKDLTQYQEKLDELITKIDRWDKIFEIDEVEYYPERIELIKNWVEEQLKKGYSVEEIREELIKNGYSTFFIEKILKEFEKKKVI